MGFRAWLATAALLIGGCAGESGQSANAGNNETLRAGSGPARSEPIGTGNTPGWDLQSSGEGVGLALLSASGATAVRLFCPAGGGQLFVNIPAFKPIGSEERLSFGGGGDAVALVADPRGDAQRGGVTGTGPVPANLASLVSGTLSASYGAQNSGPHPAAPANLARAFTAACSEGAAGPSLPQRQPEPDPASIGACRTQDGKTVPANRIRAIGTEPFWGARIDGRCVTYSHPDDQQGTRVWTRFTGTAANGNWSGALGGSPFVLRTRAASGCSDGMSDNRYPIAVTLTVGGEQRTGCAQPL